MSTRQFQAYFDALEAFQKAEKTLKHTRKEFVTHIRQTGTALRKDFIDNTTTVVAIATKVIECSINQSAMLVEIWGPMDSFNPKRLPHGELSAIKNHLRDQGWAIKEEQIEFDCCRHVCALRCI